MKLPECFNVLGIKCNNIRTFNDIKLLKKAYRNKAKILHPDNKKTGNSTEFKRINKAYLLLKGVLLARENDHSFEELKQNSNVSRDFSSSIQNSRNSPQNSNHSAPRKIANEKGIINKDKFNEMFEEFNIKEPGYTKKDFEKYEANFVNVPKLAKKTTRNQFNQAFNERKQMQHQHNKKHDIYQMQKYRPQECYDCPEGNIHILGRKATEYTKTTGKGLKYTDYLKAHTVYNAPVPVNVHKKKIYKNMDELKMERNNIQLSEEEFRQMNIYKQEQIEKNKWREERWKNEIERVGLQYKAMRNRLSY